MSLDTFGSTQSQMRHSARRPAVTALPSFDLSRPMARVAKEHPDWDKERLAAAESSYRIFLLECASSSGAHSPKGDVDEVWHAHILHTRQYADDCKRYCSYFIHHSLLDKVDECDADTCRPCESDPNEVLYQ